MNVLVIIGPTATGKTALSIKLAKRFKGEIVSSDSTQVYKMMDIGTAKVTESEQQSAPHYLIDVYDPSYPFSVKEFQALAQEKIEDIHKRDHLPILVGGTGLYVEAVTYGYSLPHVPENKKLRASLYTIAKEKGNFFVHEKLNKVDSQAAERIHPNDVKRVIRALEIYEKTKQPLSSGITKRKPLYNLLWIGLTMPRDQLYERINDRVDQMIQAGLIEEVLSLKKKGYHRNLTSMQAIGYKEIMSYLEGEISLPTAVETMKKNTRRYAKRQLTWFNRISEVHWFDVTQMGIDEDIQRLVEGKFFP